MVNRTAKGENLIKSRKKNDMEQAELEPSPGQKSSTQSQLSSQSQSQN